MEPYFRTEGKWNVRGFQAPRIIHTMNVALTILTCQAGTSL